MKKITLLMITLAGLVGFAQQKSTGVVTLNGNMTAKIDLNQGTSTVTLTITNLASSWFGLGFEAAPSTPGDGMPALVDTVVMRSATNFSDSRTRATGTGNPDIDPTQNWTVSSNTVSGTTRTVVATRAFNTGDANDYVFDYDSTALNLIFTSPGSGDFALNYHGAGSSRGHFVAPLTVLGVEDFSLQASKISPNPSNGNFVIESKSSLDVINVYSQTGALIRSLNGNDSSTQEINLSDLTHGVYFLELKNESEKSWKKIVIE
jgi:hypothetical protein